MATPSGHQLSPERQQQLTTLKLVWLFVAEQANTWPDQLKLSTQLGRDLGIGAVEGHRLLSRFAEEFRGSRIEAERYFGVAPASLQWAWAWALLRRVLTGLHRMRLYPARPGDTFAVAGAKPLPLSLLCAAALLAKEPGLGGLDQAERIVFGLEHDLNHWARHLERLPSRGLGGLLALFNRTRALNRE